MGLDIQRLAKRAVLSQIFDSPGSKWKQLPKVHKEPRKSLKWRTPLQKYQYDVVEPEASSSDFNYDFRPGNQHIHPYNIPGYRPDFNIGLNGNDTWSPSKMFGAPTPNEDASSFKWSSILNKVPTPIFGAPFEKPEDISPQPQPESTWLSDVLSKIY